MNNNLIQISGVCSNVRLIIKQCKVVALADTHVENNSTDHGVIILAVSILLTEVLSSC